MHLWLTSICSREKKDKNLTTTSCFHLTKQLLGKRPAQLSTNNKCRKKFSEVYLRQYILCKLPRSVKKNGWHRFKKNKNKHQLNVSMEKNPWFSTNLVISKKNVSNNQFYILQHKKHTPNSLHLTEPTGPWHFMDINMCIVFMFEAKTLPECVHTWQ